MTLARRVAVLMIVGLLLSAGFPRLAAAQQNGTIDGQITNGTAGAAVPADLEVVVHILQNRTKIGEQRVRTDAEGKFRGFVDP